MVAGGIHVISIGIGVYVVVSSVAGAGGALDVGAGGALDVVGAGGGEWIAGAGGCCCREVERWKEDDENGYHGNELHKPKIFSVLPTPSYYYVSDAYTHAVSVSST